MADPIPMRINWRAGEGLSRRAYGYLAFEAAALHFICLRDDSERAALAGQAAARQFGLAGALVGAGVSAAREAGRAKELRELYEAQQLTPVGKRVALNPLSRTIAREEITALQKGKAIVHALKLSDGTVLSLNSEERTVYPALEEWCAAVGVPTEIVLPKPFPWKVVGGIVAAPFVLAALHFLISVPYALKNQSVNRERVAQAEAMRAKIDPAFAAITGPVGHSLADACGQQLQRPLDQITAYVGPLPASVQPLAGKDATSDYPRITVVEPPYSKWDTGQVRVDDLNRSMQWAHPSFGRSYSLVLEHPFGWGKAAERSPLRDLSEVKLYIVGKATSVEQIGQGYDSQGVAQVTASVLDAQTGAKLCDGDLSIGFVPSTVGFPFMMSQALPLGLLLPSCPKDEGLCHEAHYYAKYAEEPKPPEPVVADAKPLPAAKKAVAKKKKR